MGPRFGQDLACRLGGACLGHASAQESQAQVRQDALKALSPDWRAHISEDHVPYRKDCEVCLQAASRGRQH